MAYISSPIAVHRESKVVPAIKAGSEFCQREEIHAETFSDDKNRVFQDLLSIYPIEPEAAASIRT
jgi:hypothetical protein